jgi:nuclease S1
VLVLFGNHLLGQPLHSYWDKEVVVRLGRDPAQVAASLDQRFGSHCHSWMVGTPAQWAQESFAVAKDVVYQFSEQRMDKHNRLA